MAPILEPSGHDNLQRLEAGPRFTVIIPCYNSAHTIAAALDSLLRQSERSFDVVIVDDASQDVELLREVLSNYRNQLPILLLENDSNRNGAFSRNRGIDAAKGAYVAFLDADDTWTDDRLASAWCTICEQSPEAFAIYGQVELVRDGATGALLPRRGIRPDEQISEYLFAAGQLMQTSTFVCTTCLAREVRFDETLSRHQDSDFMMRLHGAGAKILFQQRKCATYNFKSGDLRRRVVTGRVSSEFCRRFLETKTALLSRKAVAGYRIAVYARVLWVEGRTSEANLLALRSLWRVGLRNVLDLFGTKVYTLYMTRFGS